MPETPQQNEARTVTVIGGGVAGMSAACALAQSGYRVQLVERRGYLGGRASSYLHPGVNEIIDNCQHVLFGCCTNLIGFYRRGSLVALWVVGWAAFFTTKVVFTVKRKVDQRIKN